MKNRTTPTPTAAAPGEAKPRKPVDKLPAGYVRVGIDTVTLDEETADALAFVQSGAVPEDRREVAAIAREAVRLMVDAALTEPLKRAVAKLRNHRLEVELRAARAEAEAAAEKVRELQARSMASETGPAPTPAEVAGEVGR